ncbi:hypothetical protein GCM10009814_40220 [Lapillicoccus jejuensis]
MYQTFEVRLAAVPRQSLRDRPKWLIAPGPPVTASVEVGEAGVAGAATAGRAGTAATSAAAAATGIRSGRRRATLLCVAREV